MSSSIEIIKQLILQQTNTIKQPVTNLYGAVAGQSPAILNQQGQQWLIASVIVSHLPSLNEFYSLYTSGNTKKSFVLQGIDGVIGITGIYFNNNGSPTATLVRGTVDLPGPAVIPLNVVANGPSNEFAVYVDSVLQRNGSGSLPIALALGSGQHVIEIVALATDLFISVPASLRIFYDMDSLEPPIWNSLTSGYLDPVLGVMGNTLIWYNDTRVGGWIVYRRELTYLGLVTTISTPDQVGKFTVEITGDFTGYIAVGDELVSGVETMGTVLQDAFDGTNTVVTLQLAAGRTDTGLYWLNRTVAVGRFTEQTRFTRNSAVGLIQWVDSNVVLGDYYEYGIISFGLFDPTKVSPMSAIREIATGDTTSPNQITFIAGYPLVFFNGQVTVKFITPADIDYDGVQVQYYDAPVTGTSSGSNGANTLNDTTKSLVVNAYNGYNIYISGGLGAGQTFPIVSNTATQFTVAGTWGITPDATSTYNIYRLIPVVTDYGIANTNDELAFTTIGEGTYYFMAFDRAGNMQDRFSGLTWAYVASNALGIPETNVVVSNVNPNGQINSNVLGITLYSIPQQLDLFFDTFTASDGFYLTNTLLTSGTSDASGNTTTTLKKTGAGWTVNAFINKTLRLVSTTGIFSGVQVRITSNTATVLTFTPDIALAPDSIAFEVLDMFPLTIAPSVLNTTRDRWNPSSATNGVIKTDKLTYTGPLNTEYTIFLDSAYTGKNTPFRLEAVIVRGNTHASGSNLTYRGATTNGNRWEYGILHSSDTVVIARYRYNSGGKGLWTNLPGVAWNRYSPNKLIVELDNDIHTFKFADAYGHNEVVLGRVTGTQGPLDSCIGWNVRGESGTDAFDSVRMLDFSKLVRIKYRVLPDDQLNKVTQYSGKATGGSTTSLNDSGKAWYVNELKGLRVLITGGPGLGSDSLIASNTANQLVPVIPFSAAITTSSTYRVYDTSFLGTERVQFWKNRNAINAQSLEFHGERVGLPAEATKRVLIDADQVPEMSMSVVKTATIGSTSEVTATITPDDDVKNWTLYAKRTTWPTLDNTPSGGLDDTYLRSQLPAATVSKTLQLSDGTWYFIGVPYDSNDSEGPRASQQLAVSSGGAIAASLWGLIVFRVGNTNTTRLAWIHSTTIPESPDTTYYVDIFVTDMAGKVTQLAATKRVWEDEVPGNPHLNFGCLDDVYTEYRTSPLTPYTKITYKINLYGPGGFVAGYNISFTYKGYYNAP